MFEKRQERKASHDLTSEVPEMTAPNSLQDLSFDTSWPPYNPSAEMVFQSVRNASNSGLLSSAQVSSLLMPPPPRYMKIRMGVKELFESLKTGHFLTIASAIPASARLRHVSYSDKSSSFELLIEDPSFEPVTDLQNVPMLEGPAFAVFPLDFPVVQRLIEEHAPGLADQLQLPPEYADASHLALSGPGPQLDLLEERD
jgi:hypothetical protein